MHTRRMSMLAFLVLWAWTAALGQNCETAQFVPTGYQRLGGGTATADYSGNTSVKGGQATYVKIRNENALGIVRTYDCGRH
jgi:hypothetical protein